MKNQIRTMIYFIGFQFNSKAQKPTRNNFCRVFVQVPGTYEKQLGAVHMEVSWPG